MMTIEEMEKKLAEIDDLRKKTDDLRKKLDEQIAELKTLEEEMPKPPHPRWKPNEGEEGYYIIGTCGDVDLQGWTNDDIDNERLSCGNIFMTREAAEFAAERRKVLAEMQEWAGDWDDNVVLTYKGNEDIVSISHVLMFRNTFGEMRFATKEDAVNCIEAVGEDRIRKYYFMIPEEKSNA